MLKLIDINGKEIFSVSDKHILKEEVVENCRTIQTDVDWPQEMEKIAKESAVEITKEIIKELEVYCDVKLIGEKNEGDS